jgi:hypothetical protein
MYNVSLFSKLFKLNFMKTKNIIISCLLALTLTSIGCKKEAPVTTTGGGGGSSTPTLTRYQSTCISTGGAVYTANSFLYSLTFTGSTYSFSRFYYTSGACTGSAFTVSSAGTFAIGSATTAPAYGFNITFTPTQQTMTLYNFAGAAASLNSTCGGATWNTGAISTFNANSSGFSCATGLGLVAANTPIYNAFVINGSLLSLGTMTYNNPGVAFLGGVATSTSIDIPSY